MKSDLTERWHLMFDLGFEIILSNYNFIKEVKHLSECEFTIVQYKKECAQT